MQWERSRRRLDDPEWVRFEVAHIADEYASAPSTGRRYLALLDLSELLEELREVARHWE